MLVEGPDNTDLNVLMTMLYKCAQSGCMKNLQAELRRRVHRDENLEQAMKEENERFRAELENMIKGSITRQVCHPLFDWHLLLWRDSAVIDWHVQSLPSLVLIARITLLTCLLTSTK